MARREVPQKTPDAPRRGFYSKALNEAEAIDLEEAVGIEGVDDEIALLRCRLKSLVAESPEAIELQMKAATTIARLVHTRYQISQEQKKSLKNAIAKVLTEVAAPLGIGVGLGAMRR